MEAVAATFVASSTREFAGKSRICNDVIRREFVAWHKQNIRDRILALLPHSRELWRLNKELLHRKTKLSSISHLKAYGQWILEDKDNANVLATTFASKSALPPPASGPKQLGESVAVQMPEFILIGSRLLVGILKRVKLDTASGPHGLPARIYRECSKELGPAIAVLVRFLIRLSFWPQICRFYRIQALYKKGAVSVPSNYRGVHLTNILAKIVERAIASVHVPYFNRVGSFGRDQWAFRKKH